MNRNWYEPEPVRTGTGMNRNWSVSIRNITAHLINDKNTSIAETCIVFNEKSVGNDPDESIGVMNFYLFDPGDFGPGGRHRPDPEVKIRGSKGLTP